MMNMKRKAVVGASLALAGVAIYYYPAPHVEGKKKRVVVVGGGYGGRSFVKHIDTAKYDVVLVDKYLETRKQPWLVDVLTQQRSIKFQPQPNYVDSISDRKIVALSMSLPTRVQDIQGECVSINEETSQVTLKSNEVLDYDYLVFATGSVPDTYRVKMDYDALNKTWFYFKDRNDLNALMPVVDQITEEDNIVVMGGGITGIELASELSRRIQGPNKENSASSLGAYRTVTILEAADRVLPRMDEAVSRAVVDHLKTQNIHIITNANITEVGAGCVKLIQKGDLPTELETKIAVWTCGVKPDQLLIRLLGTNKVGNHLELTTTSNKGNIFAIGDCNQHQPKSAQNSKQQGAFLARLFNSHFTIPDGFQFDNQGVMIRLSDRVYVDSPYFRGAMPLFVHKFFIWLDW